MFLNAVFIFVSFSPNTLKFTLLCGYKAWGPNKYPVALICWIIVS